ncbi:hypothetical protein GEMRC1_004598 [Eukaryota sp. GEM-RC1]
MLSFTSLPNASSIKVLVSLQLFKGSRSFFQQEVSLFYDDNNFEESELQELCKAFYQIQLNNKGKTSNPDWELEVKYKATGSMYRLGVTSTIAGWIASHSGEGMAFQIKVNPIDIDKEAYKVWQSSSLQREVVHMPVTDLQQANPGISAAPAIWRNWASLIESGKADITLIPAELTRFFSAVDEPPSEDEDNVFGNAVAQMVSRELIKIDTERSQFDSVQRNLLWKKIAAFCHSLKRRSSGRAVLLPISTHDFNQVAEVNDSHAALNGFQSPTEPHHPTLRSSRSEVDPFLSSNGFQSPTEQHHPTLRSSRSEVDPFLSSNGFQSPTEQHHPTLRSSRSEVDPFLSSNGFQSPTEQHHPVLKSSRSEDDPFLSSLHNFRSHADQNSPVNDDVQRQLFTYNIDL